MPAIKLSGGPPASTSPPLFLIHESYGHKPWDEVVTPNGTKGDDGFVSLPEGTGLCLDIDEAALNRIANDPDYKYQWRGARFLPDGSVADY